MFLTKEGGPETFISGRGDDRATDVDGVRADHSTNPRLRDRAANFLFHGDSSMRVLITGGGGFIGSHLSDAYLARGNEVFVLDDLSTGSIDNIRHLRKHPRFHYQIDSVHHQAVVAELVDQCDVVFHLAAAVGVKLIVESPVRTIETNVHGTEVVLAQANKKKK